VIFMSQAALVAGIKMDAGDRTHRRKKSLINFYAKRRVNQEKSKLDAPNQIQYISFNDLRRQILDVYARHNLRNPVALELFATALIMDDDPDLPDRRLCYLDADKYDDIIRAGGDIINIRCSFYACDLSFDCFYFVKPTPDAQETPVDVMIPSQVILGRTFEEFEDRIIQNFRFVYGIQDIDLNDKVEISVTYRTIEYGANLNMIARNAFQTVQFTREVFQKHAVAFHHFTAIYHRYNLNVSSGESSFSSPSRGSVFSGGTPRRTPGGTPMRTPGDTPRETPRKRPFGDLDSRYSRDALERTLACLGAVLDRWVLTKKSD